MSDLRSARGLRGAGVVGGRFWGTRFFAMPGAEPIPGPASRERLSPPPLPYMVAEGDRFYLQPSGVKGSAGCPQDPRDPRRGFMDELKTGIVPAVGSESDLKPILGGRAT